MVSSNVLLDSIQIEIGGENEWPDDAKLFQPYETEQILMPDSANCLAVQAFLQMANLKYETVYKANAAEMSPTGRVPFIKVGQYLVAELEPIVAFVQNKNISLTSNLTDAEKSDMRAYMSLINTVFGNAENYVTWCDSETYSKVTKKRFGSVHPFPLNHILLWRKRSTTIERMKALGGKTEQDAVLDDVDLCCQSLSDRLGDRDFFFKSGPTELDCLLYAHVSTILNWPHLHVGKLLAQIICKYPKLVCHGIAMKNRICSQKSDVFSVYGPLLTIYNNICSTTKKKKIQSKDSSACYSGACYNCANIVSDGQTPPFVLFATSSSSSGSELCSSSSVESRESDSVHQTGMRVHKFENKGCKHARSCLNKEFRSDVTAFSRHDRANVGKDSNNMQSCSNEGFCSDSTAFCYNKKNKNKGCRNARFCSDQEFASNPTFSSCQNKKDRNKSHIGARSCLNKTFCSDIVASSSHNRKRESRGCNNTKSFLDKESFAIKKCKKGKHADVKSKRAMHVRIEENVISNSTSAEVRRVQPDDQIASNLAFESSNSTPACYTSQRESSSTHIVSKSDTPMRFESLSFLNCPQLFNICGSVMDAMRIGCLAGNVKESTALCKNDRSSSYDETTKKCLPSNKTKNNTLETCDDSLSLSGSSSSSSIVCTKTEKVDVKLFTNETNQRPCIKIARAPNCLGKTVNNDLSKSSNANAKEKKFGEPRKKVEENPCSDERRTKIDVSYYDSSNAESCCFQVLNSEEENNKCDVEPAWKVAKPRGNRSARRSKSKSQCRCPLRKCIYGVSEKKTWKSNPEVSDVKRGSENTNSISDRQVCPSSSSESSVCDVKSKVGKGENKSLNSCMRSSKMTSEEKENPSQDECEKINYNSKKDLKLEQETCVYVDQVVSSNLKCPESKSFDAQSEATVKEYENSCPLVNPGFLEKQSSLSCFSESLENPPCTQIVFDDKTTDKTGYLQESISAQRSRQNPLKKEEDSPKTLTLFDDRTTSKSGCQEKSFCTQRTRKSCRSICDTSEDLLCTQIVLDDKTSIKSDCQENISALQGKINNARSISEILEDPPYTQILLKADKFSCQDKRISARGTRRKEKLVNQNCRLNQEINSKSIKEKRSVESKGTRDNQELSGQVACDISAENDIPKRAVAKITHIPVPVKSKLKGNVNVYSKIDAKDGNLSVSFSKSQKVSKKILTKDIESESSSHSKLDIKEKKSLDVGQCASKEQSKAVAKKSAHDKTCLVVGFDGNAPKPKSEMNCAESSERKTEEEETVPLETSSRKISETDARETNDLTVKINTVVCKDSKTYQTVRDQHSVQDTCNLSSIFVNEQVKNSPVEGESVHFGLSLDSVSCNVLKALPVDESASECDLSGKIRRAAQNGPSTMSMNNILSKLSDEGESKLEASYLCSQKKSPPKIGNFQNRSVSEDLKPLDMGLAYRSSDESSAVEPMNFPVSKISVRQNLGECANFAFTENLDTQCADIRKPANNCSVVDKSTVSVSEVRPSNCPISKISIRQNVGECENFAFTENLDKQFADKKTPGSTENSSQKRKAKEKQPASKN